MATRSAWQDVHLFVSSTFRDTQAERDVLVRRVFPVLRAELLPHKIRLGLHPLVSTIFILTFRL